MKQAAVCVLLVFCTAFALEARQGPDEPGDEEQSVQAFVLALEKTLASSDPSVWAAMLSQNAHRESAMAFFNAAIPTDVTRAVIRERDRLPLDGALPGEGFRLLTDVFLEAGSRGRIHTWRIDIRRPRGSEDPQPWRILAQESLSTVDGLHRLSLDTGTQFAVRDLRVTSVDFELRLPSGDVFLIDTADGVTGMVLLGNGTMVFTPQPSEEQGQVRIFAGSNSIDTSFSKAYLRFSPFAFDQQMQAQLTETRIDARTARRAQEVFDEEVGKSFSLDLRDLSRDNWSLLPQPGDFLAEVQTRRHDTLTYARSTAEAEDVTLFQRKRRRNISAYASEMKLISRGRFFNEDDLTEIDILDYDIDTHFTPDRDWLEGQTQLTLRVRAYALAALTLRLADDLNVTSITSPSMGRLMFLRVRNQNSVVVNLPAPLPRDATLTLVIAYAGPMQAQSIDAESVTQAGNSQAQLRADDLPFVPAERNWLLSSRSYWYPQSGVTDYATADIRFSVPAAYQVVASGIPAAESPIVVSQPTSDSPGRVMFIYRAAQPVRYFGAIVSDFTRVDDATVAVDVEGPRNTVKLAVEANRRQIARGQQLLETSAEIVRFYASIAGDTAYDAVTVAMVEDERPGGHSPAYFAILNNPPPLTTYGYRNDPASFSDFPEFFIAHEIAHQWWGQAVGWKNYHEQWLSEGFSQYFAALYAREARGERTFRDVLRQLRRWAMEQSDQGAVYLGYRLGHIKGDSRVFRAIAYNKGAAVLHMLRRLVGDDAFFRGLRRYYAENRYAKAGTADLQRAMEAESKQTLDRFFERWIYESGLPRLRYSTATQGDELVVRFEQQTTDTYDIPVTVTIEYSDRTIDEVVVSITERVVEQRVPLAGRVRTVTINADHAALGHFDRR